jgi:hypothetical protein
VRRRFVEKRRLRETCKDRSNQSPHGNKPNNLFLPRGADSTTPTTARSHQLSANTDDRDPPRRLTGLPAATIAAGYVPVDYRLFRDAAINGRIPAHQKSGYWMFYPEDLDKIAKALRLPRDTDARQARQHVAA